MKPNTLFQRRGIISEPQALDYINELLKAHDLPVLERNHQGWRVLRTLMEKEGDAEPASGRRGEWWYDKAQLSRWREYIAKRAALMRMGIYNQRQPYSIDDMIALVDSGSRDGEVDHPLFAPASAK